MIAKPLPAAAPPLFQQAMALCRAGRYPKAESAFRQLRAADPSDPRLAFHLGLTLAQQNRMALAAEAFAAAAALDDRHSAVFNNLGNALYQLGRVREAADAWQRAVALSPGEAGLYVNLANAMYRLGRLEDAVAALERAIDLGADDCRVRNNLGQTLQKLGRHEAAVAVFRAALKADASNATAAHLLAALTGANPEAPPSAYVTEVFDRLAPDFERHLCDDLEYQTPLQLRNLFDRHRPARARCGHLIDLGCGTGLSGIAFQDLAIHRTGIDLSAGMLSLALVKKVYDALYQAGIVPFLTATEERYDLVIAADTLCYTGNLDPVFAAIRRCMAPEAFLVFSLESAEIDGYHLDPSGRYAHGTGYVEKLMRRHEFTLLAMEKSPLRKERKAWVQGHLVLAQAEAAPSVTNQSHLPGAPYE